MFEILNEDTGEVVHVEVNADDAYAWIDEQSNLFALPRPIPRNVFRVQGSHYLPQRHAAYWPKFKPVVSLAAQFA